MDFAKDVWVTTDTRYWSKALRMPPRDSNHVVAIDFAPHTESMQTNDLLAYSASGVPVFKKGEYNMAALVLFVGVVVTIIIVAAS